MDVLPEAGEHGLGGRGGDDGVVAGRVNDARCEAEEMRVAILQAAGDVGDKAAVGEGEIEVVVAAGGLEQLVERGFDAAEIVAGDKGEHFEAVAEIDEGDGLLLVSFARAVFEQGSGVAGDAKGLGLVKMAERAVGVAVEGVDADLAGGADREGPFGFGLDAAGDEGVSDGDGGAMGGAEAVEQEREGGVVILPGVFGEGAADAGGFGEGDGDEGGVSDGDRAGGFDSAEEMKALMAEEAGTEVEALLAVVVAADGDDGDAAAGGEFVKRVVQ